MHMQKTLAFALCAAVGAAASAHPFGERWSTPNPGPVGGGVDRAVELNEDFEAYAVGAGVSTRGGWELWPSGGDATVTDARAASGTKSANFSVTGADVVHRFSGIDSGTVTYSANIYIPSTGDVEFYMIALNQYDGGGVGTNWSMQVKFDSLFGTVESQYRGFQTNIIYDRWVELRAEIDLDADRWNLYYDGVLFAPDQIWTEGSFAGGPGITEFAAIDIYTDFAGTGNDVYVDDVRVETGAGGCYADCDGSGTLDFFDFLCFQNAFSVQDPYADCDGSGTWDFFDFLCFQNEFSMGCP